MNEVNELHTATEDNSENSIFSGANKRPNCRYKRKASRNVTVLSSLYVSSMGEDNSDLSFTGRSRQNSHSNSTGIPNMRAAQKGNNSGILSRFAQQRKRSESSDDSQESSEETSQSSSDKDSDQDTFPKERSSTINSPTSAVALARLAESPIHAKDPQNYPYSKFRPSSRDSSPFKSPNRGKLL